MLMKTLAGAAAAAVLMSPGLAAAEVTGHAAFSYNSLDDDTSGNEDYIELNGAFAAPLGGSWNLQFDAAAQNTDHGGHTHTESTAALHAFSRSDGFAFGGFAGFTGVEEEGWFIGAEGALYLDRFTLAGSGLLGGDREDSNSEFNGVSGSATFFLSDNFSLGADVSYHSFFEDGEEGTIYGVNAEYQFGNAFSIFGGYHSSEIDDFGTDREVNSFTIGGRFNLGTSTLLERDRRGASMPGANMLHRAQPFSL